MDPYRCYYCDATETTERDILYHSKENHLSLELKYKKYTICPRSGKYGFQTLKYKVIPAELEKSGRTICIDEQGLIINRPLLRSPLTISPLQKKVRKNNDIDSKAKLKLFKKSDGLQEIIVDQSDNDLTSIIDVEDGGDTVNDDDKELSTMINMLPAVIDFLRANNQLDVFMRFLELMATNKFPPNQIAYLLFLDVVRLLSCNDVRQMRYTEEIKLFWRIGSRLFHGRFLRFMTGQKSNVEELNDDRTPFNFAVPTKYILQTNQVFKSSDVKPGLLPNMLNIYANTEGSHTYKLCVDGKKLNISSKSEKGGVDLFGYEEKPTAMDRLGRLTNETEEVNEIDKILVNFNVRNLTELRSAILKYPKECVQLLYHLKNTITLLSLRISDLRQMKVKKSLTLKKLKDFSGSNWRNSKYSFAISHLHTSLYQIEEAVDECISAIDSIGLACSMINRSDRHYVTGDLAYMQFQENHVCLTGIESVLENDEERQLLAPYIRQRTDTWHNLRNSAKVTGSSINRALGLESLKKQNEYIASRFHKVIQSEPTDNQKTRMKYGAENEINAVSTLVCKIMPVHFPNMQYFEEGCHVLKHDGETFLVVSPDGSCRFDEGTIIACEFKCPYPDKTYTTQVHYKIPKYYVTQILSEMYSLQADQLIYLSYTKETTTAFLVHYDPELWNEILTELVSVYGKETPRKLSRLSVASKVLKDKVMKFLETNVTFLGEYKSIDAVPCSHPSPTSKTSTRIGHASIKKREKISIGITNLQGTIDRARKLFREADHLTKLIAAEILVFMISDVDRIFKPEMPHAIPVAYGLKGYSLRAENLRNMINHVLQVCNASGLHVPVISFDGQWARIAMRDKDGNPLTILQLQKDVQKEARTMTKSEQIRRLMNANRITNVKNIDDVKEIAFVELKRSSQSIEGGKTKLESPVIIGSLKQNTKINTPRNAIRFLLPKKSRKEVIENNDGDCEDGDNENIDCLLQSIPQEEHEKIDEECIEAIKEKNRQQSNLDLINEDVFDILREGWELLQDQEGDDVPQEEDADEIRQEGNEMFLAENELLQNNITLETNQVTEGDIEVDHDQGHKPECEKLEQKLDEIKVRLKGNGGNQREKHWMNVNDESLKQKLATAESIHKSFHANEILVLLEIFSDGTDRTKKSERKYTLVNTLCHYLKITGMDRPPQRKQTNPMTFRNICKKVLSSKVSKEFLNIVFATHMMPDKLRKFQTDTIFTNDIKVQELQEPSFWYSQPLRMGDDHITFPILDNEHLLVNTRVKCCSSGMKEAGISKEAWLKVARNCKENKTGLTLAHVDDLIDKQSCAFAMKTFSREVEEEMRRNGDIEEANFAKLIREWYEGEDKPGLSPLDRITRRLRLRSWLLNGIQFDSFPVCGSHVKGIPTVLYEGFLTNIERHIQLYSYVKQGSYNARAIGTLDIENFFGEFTEIDPKGNGILRPDDIPQALATACEVLYARMNTSRCFSMRTSSARMYPVKDLIQENEMDIEEETISTTTKPKSTIIAPRFHLFDLPKRGERRPKRKSGEISKPGLASKGAQPIRSTRYKVNESLILPHKKVGIEIELD